MLSRLAQGVNSVLQELSGEESPEAGAEVRQFFSFMSYRAESISVNKIQKKKY